MFTTLYLFGSVAVLRRWRQKHPNKKSVRPKFEPSANAQCSDPTSSSSLHTGRRCLPSTSLYSQEGHLEQVFLYQATVTSSPQPCVAAIACVHLFDEIGCANVDVRENGGNGGADVSGFGGVWRHHVVRNCSMLSMLFRAHRARTLKP